MAEQKRAGLTGTGLKWIAILSMLVDHMAVVLLEPHVQEYMGKTRGWQAMPGEGQRLYIVYMLLRQIGRLAFPIFCFLIVQGVLYTSNRRNYVIRMALFALLSEVPFDLAFYSTPFYWGYQNVFLTLLLGILAIYGMDRWRDKPVLFWGSLFLAALAAFLLRTDYGAGGVILLAMLWIFRMEEGRRNILCSLWLLIGIGLGEAAAPLAFLPIHFYNGQRGHGYKYVFYLFYPLHLLLLAGIAWMIY